MTEVETTSPRVRRLPNRSAGVDSFCTSAERGPSGDQTMPRFQTLTAVVTLAALLTAPFMQTAQASPIGGVIYETRSVEAHSRDTFSAIFRGRERGAVVLSGDGDTDLDLYVYNEAGRLLASDTDNTDECAVTFFVPSTQEIYIVVVNHGRVYNDYEVAAL